jgi:hypothetical protein
MDNPEIQVETGRNADGTFKPGFSGNPNGKPKRKTFRDYFTEKEEGELMERVKAAMSEKEIMKMIVEQVFGKPKQPLVGGDEDDKPISILTNALLRNNSSSQDSETNEEN